jgi:hypothetical protein
MRYAFLMFVAGCCLGCGESAELTALKSSLQVTGEEVVAKQDQSIEILKANTEALTAIKSAVENLSQQSTGQTDQQIVETLEAIKTKLDAPKPLPVAESEPVVVPLIEPQVGKIVHAPPVKTTASKAKLRWNVNGNWNPTITETATHLRAEHGVSIDGMTEQQLHDLHAELHEGKSGGQPVGAIFPNPPASAITSQRTDFRPVTWGQNFVSRARYSTRQSCPSGRCPRR